jgi:hypothetical protein
MSPLGARPAYCSPELVELAGVRGRRRVGEGSRDHGRTVLGVGRGRDGPGGDVRRRPAVAAAAACTAARLGDAGVGQRRGKAGEGGGAHA